MQKNYRSEAAKVMTAAETHLRAGEALLERARQYLEEAEVFGLALTIAGVRDGIAGEVEVVSRIAEAETAMARGYDGIT